MLFEQIRSATSIVTFGGIRFLVDPWFAPKGSVPPIPGSPNPDLSCPLCDLPKPIEELLLVDAVIATHLHFDHFDESAMRCIPPDMPIFAQDVYDADTLTKRGFRHVMVLTYAEMEGRNLAQDPLPTWTGSQHVGYVRAGSDARRSLRRCHAITDGISSALHGR